MSNAVKDAVIGVLHPGAMGASVAAAARSSGARVLWASEGRSAATAERAAAAGLEDAGTLADLCRQAPIILSICPPDAAEELAETVMATGFAGIYVDGNAIAPERARRIAGRVEAAGAVYVDGGIIGPPAAPGSATCLYLSGAEANTVAALFTDPVLEARVLDETPDRASALKMCYAAQTKGLTALLCALVAAAEEMGVREALFARWAGEDAGKPDQIAARIRGVTAKAWRFEGEMREIAATLVAAGLPGGFHLAAAELYSRLAHFKDAGAMPPLEEVLAALSDGVGVEPLAAAGE
jgi:3-hydroxyisobutyrate dehydrogenase-like beta-hydroxyacid dehydrogenase